ncbi:hypothetical protein [Marinifilum sp.]|uniref:hypothetical protein n=1 Tax=Marinifilum sp. TaxID=2033137 RepID=UPI003BAAEDEE
MKIYCLIDFKIEFDKLKSILSYHTLEKDIIKHFFDKSYSDLYSGMRLNNSCTTPYIKKRIRSIGGFPFYFLYIIKDEKLYLLYVHPRTGTLIPDTKSDEAKAHLYKRAIDAIENNKFFELKLNDEKNHISFNLNFF